MAYSIVTQLFPSLVMSLMRTPWVTSGGAMTGIVVGEATVAAVTLSNAKLPELLPGLPHGITDINIGTVALLLNVTSMLAVSALRRPPTSLHARL